LFEALNVISASFPDPRLWNNRIAAFAGTVRSTTALGMSAASAASDAEIYGHKPMVRSFLLLQNAMKCVEKGGALDDLLTVELKQKRVVAGYGRPIVDNDERIKPLLEYAKSLGFGKGRYVSLAFEIEKITLSFRYRMQMNIAGLCAALVLDQGVSLEEYDSCTAFAFVGGMIPCHVDALSKEEGAFFPLRTDRINYIGCPVRSWGDE